MDTNPAQEVAEDSLMDTMNKLVFSDEKPSEEVASEEVEDESSDETEDEPEAELSDEQPAEDESEVELDGEKLRLPKKVAEAVMRQQDYTKKTQEVAEQRRAVEDRQQYLEAREQVINASLSDLSELQALQKQAAQFDSVDWNSLITDDPQQALRLSLSRQHVQQQLTAKQTELQGKVSAFEQQRKQHLEKQMELGRAELRRRVGNLSANDSKNTWEQGLSLGFSKDELESIPDPRVMHALYKAAKWDALQTAKPTAMKKANEAPKAPKPVAPTPKRVQENRSASDRLKRTGRAEELINFL
jgi:exonuclease VII large subunit